MCVMVERIRLNESKREGEGDSDRGVNERVKAPLGAKKQKRSIFHSAPPPS